MISVKDALTLTLKATYGLGDEEVSILEALGQILAEDVYSDIDMPPFDKSSMDGYALKTADCLNVPAFLNVVGTIPAGTYPQFGIESGQAAKIMTGAPLPEGADSVQMVEKTEDVGDQVKILESVSFGKNVARKGEIIKASACALSKGTYLSPAAIGVLAAFGKEKVKIYKRPRIGILVTGDELVEVNQKPRTGQIRNSNGYTLYNQVLESGALPELFGIASDNIGDLRKKIELGLSKDILLISGGVSMGDFDRVEDVLDEFEVKIFYEKVNIKPGKPTVFGKSSNCLVFGLPGNPVSASTVFEVIVRPTLRKMMNFSQLHNFKAMAILEKDFHGKTQRENYQPAWTYFKNNDFFTVPISSKGSADVVAFSRSNSYVITTEPKQEFKKGERIETMLRHDFWRGGCNRGLVS